MAKVIPITERFQHFVAELQESFGAICRDRRGPHGRNSSNWCALSPSHATAVLGQQLHSNSSRGLAERHIEGCQRQSDPKRQV